MTVLIGGVCLIVGLLGARKAAALVKSREEARARSLARVRGLPSTITLVQLVAATGVGPRTSVAAVGGLSLGHGDLAVVVRELHDVAHQLELGASFANVLLDADGCLDEGLHRTLDVLRRAEVDGSALEVHLNFLVRDLRRVRRLALDAAAQRLTVLLLFPLIVCILPAFVLLAIVPLLIEALSGLPG